MLGRAAVLASLLLLLPSAAAAPNATHIVVGQTTDLSAHNAEFGRSSRAGLQAAFSEANAAGVLSRNLTLVTLDDGSNATMAERNFRLLASTFNVSFLTASYGTDTLRPLVALVMQSGLPLIGPFAGSPTTRAPFRRPVVNVRASWADEVAAHAKLLMEQLRVQRIAAFYELDEFDFDVLGGLTQALGAVGTQLTAIGRHDGSPTSMTAAVESILAASQRAQAVLVLAEEERVVSFISKFRQDPRADPNCTFHILSIGASPSFSSKIGRQHWPQLYFTQTVPTPDSGTLVARHFTSLPPAFLAPQYRTDVVALEGYVVGRLIVDVLKPMKVSRITPQGILDQLYTTHLYAVDDLLLGLYMDDQPGCEDVLCNCSAGIRKVFLSQLDPANGTFTAYGNWPVSQYPVTSCAADGTIARPVLFGQLVPLDDPVATAIAQNIAEGVIECYEADVNPAGGLFNRPFQLVQYGYRGDPVAAAKVFVDRYPLSALLGSVVRDASAITFPILAIGTYSWTPHTADPAFRVADVQVQPSAPQELMALISYAAIVSPNNLHFRVRANFSTENFMDLLVRTANTVQLQPTTAALFTSAAQALDGLSDGFVVALGTDDDMQRWAELLVTRPHLTLLTLGPSVHRLVAANRTSALTQTAFARMWYASVSRGVQDSWGTATVPDYWEYGHLVGHLSAYALSLQYLNVPYVSPDTMVTDWYAAKLLKQGDVVVGPYAGANCTAAVTQDCGCNLGARNLAIISPNATLTAPYTYTAPTCRVQYYPLIIPSDSSSASIVLPVALGVSLGTVALAALLWLATQRGQRNNRAAPKDASHPFCIVFTDIQSSTSLWATIPDVMAGALDVHHSLIRKLISKHQCYEVKTIGDSFMCATKNPAQALRFALALQQDFVEHDWGTTRIDQVYAAMVAEETPAPGCWNGLRVRVGIHFGLGDIKLDPVSQGYDYYGTVVNTAARIESVCHGGQIGVSQAVYDAVCHDLPEVVWEDLGDQPLRSLAQPVRLYQALPIGHLSTRTFPALRLEKLEKQDLAADASEIEIVSTLISHDSSHAAAEAKANSVVPSGSHGSTTETFHWVETHPLVLQGDVGPEELKKHYVIASATLATLLATQTERFREQMVHSLCERLHVANYGVQGTMLHRTLRGLVHRVLPATVVNAQQQLQKCLTRQNSKLSIPTSPVGSSHAPCLAYS
eukprot:EG_transcript_933